MQGADGLRCPSGTVTFLFTDIEGSTGLWESDPEAMRAALERHDSILRTAIDGHGGYVFSTGGDGFAAAFTRALDALQAAIDAQAALADEAWPREKWRSVKGITSAER
jgi:class 3 adenylate cyclase